jgi:RimJ/RimL family protein N-acetyltransferase
MGGAAYAIADPETDRLIGGVGFDARPAGRQQAEIGYWVSPWARGRGVASAAVRALSGWAFGHDVARIELLTEWENVASQRVALAAGFQREGVRRGAAANRAGDRVDFVVFTRLADDPAGPTPRLLPDLPDGRLTDGVVTLRPTLPEDVDFYLSLQAVPDIVATGFPPVRRDVAEVTRRCSRAQAWWLAGERVDLVIVDAATGAPAGDIGLYYQEPPTGQAMIGYSMLPQWRGRGYAARAATLLSSWAFAATGIGRLIAGTLPDNVGSQRVLQKAGYRREGFLRGRLPGADGGRTDDVLFALLAEDLEETP